MPWTEYQSKGLTFNLGSTDAQIQSAANMFSTLLRALQMCWEHRTKWAPSAQREAEWWQGQQHCFLDYVHKDRTQFVNSTALDRAACWHRRLYSTHSTRTKCIQMVSSRLPFSVFQIFINFSSAFIFMKSKNKQDSPQLQVSENAEFILLRNTHTHTHTHIHTFVLL